MKEMILNSFTENCLSQIALKYLVEIDTVVLERMKT